MGTNINTVIQETETPNTFDFRKLLKYLLSVTLIYCVVGLLGITTSHTSTLFGNVNEKSNVILGEARQQRADEFLRGSPRVIAYLRGIEATSYTPLDYTGTLEFQQNKKALLARINYSFSPINEIVIDQVSQRLPLQMGFSLLWWQNVWLLFAVLPVWFFLLGRNLRTGILALKSYCTGRSKCLSCNDCSEIISKKKNLVVNSCSFIGYLRRKICLHRHSVPSLGHPSHHDGGSSYSSRNFHFPRQVASP